MNYILNFDVFFIILLIVMSISAIFKKSNRYYYNFFIFLLTTTTVGLLAYFNVLDVVFAKLGVKLAPLFPFLHKYFAVEFLQGVIYFGCLLILDVLAFIFIKAILYLFTNENRKFKNDLTYTPRHNGFAAFLISFLRFVVLAHVILIIFVYLNPIFGFNVENSIFINMFIKYEKPVLEFIQTKGVALFDALGY